MNKMKDLKEVSSEDLRQELELRGLYRKRGTGASDSGAGDDAWARRGVDL